MKSTIRTAMRRMVRACLLACSAALACSLAWAQAIEVQDPWVRATLPGQRAAGVFMRLRAAQGARLLYASTPVAARGQVHTMHLEGDVMQMHALPDGLELPPGKVVELKPGSLHLMLMDLKAPLRQDSSIALTLVYVDAQGVEGRMELSVPVRSLAYAAH